MNPVAVFLSFAAAIFDGVKDGIAKKSLDILGVWTTAAIWETAVAFVLLPLLFIKPFPHIPLLFWGVLLVRNALEISGSFFFLKSVAIAEVSEVVPLTASIPVFVLVGSFFINAEIPNVPEILGIVLITLGGYWLKRVAGTKIVLSPGQTKTPFYKSGVFYMIVASLSWALTTSFHKIGLQVTNVFFYSSFSTVTLAIVLWVIASIFERKDFGKITWRAVSIPASVGVLNAGSFFLLRLAQLRAPNASIVAIKNTSILLTTFVAGFMYKEEIKKRIVPTLIMVAGVILIVIG